MTYKMTASDREPRTLFGKTYFWSLSEAGNLTLLSARGMTDEAREVFEALRND